MKPLKALIGKRNIHRASTSDLIYCIASWDFENNLDDILDKEFIKLQTRDYINVYVGKEKDVIRYADKLNNLDVSLWKVVDKNMTIQKVIEFLMTHDWVSFFNNAKLSERCFEII